MISTYAFIIFYFIFIYFITFTCSTLRLLLCRVQYKSNVLLLLLLLYVLLFSGVLLLEAAGYCV